MSRLRHKKPEKVCNKRKAEMKKARKEKNICFQCVCKIKNNKIKSETAEINQKYTVFSKLFFRTHEEKTEPRKKKESKTTVSLRKHFPYFKKSVYQT